MWMKNQWIQKQQAFKACIMVYLAYCWFMNAHNNEHQWVMKHWSPHCSFKTQESKLRRKLEIKVMSF